MKECVIMKSKLKNMVITVTFLAIIAVLCAANLLHPDQEISYTERRKLAQAPEFTVKTVLDGEAFSEIDEYLTDQFVWRETFRRIKAAANFGVFAKLDNNGVAIANGSAIKLETELRERAILNAAAKLNGLYEQYFANNRVFLAVVPEKNYYLAEKNGYPVMDYEKIAQMVRENLRGEINYIDLFESIDERAYYITDPHWRQEELQGLLDNLGAAMDFAPADLSSYEKHKLSPFYGAYYGQSSLPLSPDDMFYLTSEYTNAATAFNYEKNETKPVYRPELFGGIDPYDIYLSGAAPLLVVESPLCKTGKELIMFRDSFGSSLAPLLLENYSKITLVDIRYMMSAYVGELVEITDQDVLFIYSSSVINNSEMLK